MLVLMKKSSDLQKTETETSLNYGLKYFPGSCTVILASHSWLSAPVMTAFLAFLPIRMIV